MIERVQKTTTSLILKLNVRDSDYETRLMELELKSLERRRFIADVTFLYKVLNNYLNLDI